MDTLRKRNILLTAAGIHARNEKESFWGGGSLSSWFYITLVVLALLIIGGVVACFWGYRRFFTGIKSAGFFIGGLLGFLVALVFALRTTNSTQIILILVAGFVIGGVIGFALSLTLNKVLTFITGALIGFFLSVLIFSPNSLSVIFGNRFTLAALNLALGNTLPLAIIISLAFGILAVLFQRPIIILSTAIWGAAWVVVPSAVAYYLMNKPITKIDLSIVSSTFTAYPIFIIATWIGLTVLGSLFQFHGTRKEKQKKSAPT
jgi:hypothetical protein